MRSGGWKSFWTAFWLTMLLLAPLVGGTILLQRQQAKSHLNVSQSQSGVPINEPKAENTLSILVCVAEEQPAFVLLRLDAEENDIAIIAVPSECAVPFGGSETSLAACYAAAGPARCVQGLNAALGVEITHYLAVSPTLLMKMTENLGPLRVGLSGVLTTQEMHDSGQEESVQEWTTEAAHEFLTQAEQEHADWGTSKITALRAAVWNAFFRQKLEQLPAALPAALRKYSSSLLTDLTAGELYTLEDTLEFLADRDADVNSDILGGTPDEESGLYRPDEDAQASAQALFSADASGTQSESASAP